MSPKESRRTVYGTIGVDLMMPSGRRSRECRAWRTRWLRPPFVNDASTAGTPEIGCRPTVHRQRGCGIVDGIVCELVPTCVEPDTDPGQTAANRSACFPIIFSNAAGE